MTHVPAVAFAALLSWGVCAPAAAQNDEAYALCKGTAAFSQVYSMSAKRWGITSRDASRAMDLLSGHALCDSVLRGTDGTCNALGSIPELQSAPDLGADCASDLHLFGFYKEFSRGEFPKAVESCKRWYEVRRELYPREIRPEELCQGIVSLMQANPKTACARLGRQLGARLSDRADAGKMAALCSAQLIPNRRSCDGRLEPDVDRCLARERAKAAIEAGRPEQCPQDPRMRSACRVAAGGGAKECSAPSGDWLKIYCGMRVRPKRRPAAPAPGETRPQAPEASEQVE